MLDQFIQNVRKRLTDFVNENREAIEAWAKENNYLHYEGIAAIEKIEDKRLEMYFNSGYTVQDCVLQLTHLEEFDPRVSEEKSLNMYFGIMQKYKPLLTVP